ncbi:MAG TPA: universal stress protein [Burkholderiaceae bacterium]|nr:universal stress protein [Burkholderiaceae bacterium]
MLARIAIHMHNDAGLQRRLRAAIQLAGRHKAQLIGIYQPDVAVPTFSEDAEAARQVMGAREKARAQEAELRQLFVEQTATSNVSSQWRTPRGPVDEALALHARYCDLLILSKAGNKDNGSAVMHNLPESVVMMAGKPILVIPAVGDVPNIGRNVLFCWDHRREAARAFSDAAPILRACTKLVVLEVNPREDDLTRYDVHDDDYSEYCVALGYPKPQRAVKKGEDYGAGNAILNACADHDTDLVVMGAYGHSRMREWIMGGASRTLLNSMTVPVLFSH